MSKRSRRARAKFRATQQPASRGEVKHPESAKAAIEPKVLKPIAESSSVLAETTKYRYILPELRRIGIISAALFVIIIILSFIIT